MSTTTERSQTHHTFVVERDVAHPVERVWQAFADLDAKRRWWGGGSDDLDLSELTDDFRVGGHGTDAGRFGDGPEHRFHSTYTDIVEHQRIVYTYDMWIDGAHISTSITTIALEPTDAGTRLTFTEQGVHLDGFDDGTMREHGTRELLDALVASLD
ncbi:SRPBCC family protein [Aeromicrobium sp. IC_218]|uniref:SRPBCC family protein n=1 Tax=Aeromicrobium sp. IC_218 TaxID=2545468 RepID=UPI00103CE5E7|nr:SRPBCC family protein [Aeromicrobium sp. IC_218]TCI99148.1 ATPase [Aeromicrobium sp. IC_218]